MSNPSPPRLLGHALLPSYVSVKQSIPVLQIAALCPAMEGVANSAPQMLRCVRQSET